MSQTITTYSLGEAVKLTGFSRNKFHYNAEMLKSAGVTIGANGWTIPHTVLEELDWLGKKNPRERTSVTVKQYENALTEIENLTAEVERLRAELDKPRSIFSRRRK